VLCLDDGIGFLPGQRGDEIAQFLRLGAPSAGSQVTVARQHLAQIDIYRAESQQRPVLKLLADGQGEPLAERSALRGFHSGRGRYRTRAVAEWPGSLVVADDGESDALHRRICKVTSPDLG